MLSCFVLVKENHPTPKAVNPTTKRVKPVKSAENEQQEYKDFEVSNMRRTIASRLTASKVMNAESFEN